jgi:EAL and modified HD-GYP domain-containing signal transduction protein
LIEAEKTAAHIHAPAPECLLGRQPIYDARREIRAYELLYRRHVADGAAQIANGDQASAEVLLKAFLEIGLATVSPEQPVFINHTVSLLALDPIVPPDRMVIEVLEDVPVNAETIGNLERLKGLGYRIALDDFIHSDAQVPFLRLAHYVKLDLRALSAAELRNHVEILKGFQLQIVAEKVESEEEFQRSKALGCDLFQGYFLRKPEVLRGRRIPANRLSALSLLSECMDPDQSAAAIATVIERDAAMSYGLLRLANSALHARAAKVQSPVQAVAMLGIDRVFRWASLLVLSGYDDCPIGYLGFALQRARACEIVAQAYGIQVQLAYMAGLLSTLDSVLNAPLADILRPLPLDEQFKRAILQREGQLGTVLDAVLGFEAGDFDAATRHGIPIQRTQNAFWEAVEYSATMMAGLRDVTAH